MEEIQAGLTISVVILLQRLSSVGAKTCNRFPSWMGSLSVSGGGGRIAEVRTVGNTSVNCSHPLLTILPWKVLKLTRGKNIFKRKDCLDSFSWVMTLPRLAQ